jgi:hypothetical protein
MIDREELRRLERRLVDDGKLIEAGWIGLRRAAVAPEADAIQLEEMRTAFFAGAQHLFGSIMGILDDDREPTAADLNRMGLINAELEIFIREFRQRHDLPGAQTQ